MPLGYKKFARARHNCTVSLTLGIKPMTVSGVPLMDPKRTASWTLLVHTAFLLPLPPCSSPQPSLPRPFHCLCGHDLDCTLLMSFFLASYGAGGSSCNDEAELGLFVFPCRDLDSGDSCQLTFGLRNRTSLHWHLQMLSLKLRHLAPSRLQ